MHVWTSDQVKVGNGVQVGVVGDDAFLFLCQSHQDRMFSVRDVSLIIIKSWLNKIVLDCNSSKRDQEVYF